MQRFVLILMALFMMTTQVWAEIKTEEVNYDSNGVKMIGFLAWDDAIQEKRPGVIVVHEWWGHNEYVRTRAKMLAELGYVALAIDMYGDGKQADHPDQAGAFSQETNKNMDVAKGRFLAGLDVLKNNPHVDGNNVAAIGYCFGGGTVLNMARLGADLKGVVSFHGSLASNIKAAPGDVKAKILVCNGADDSFIPEADITAFKEEMDQAKADYEFINYPGAKHSFTNPDADMFAQKFGMPIAYNQVADEQSWTDMQKFLNSIFNSKQ
ncbi:MAG: dienelactone hydrolase family protein [Candidatus Omnitrophica bacterium]|nr:dienelactone hydrolase family protein [Candidatus Omnitrophota bacterium]